MEEGWEHAGRWCRWVSKALAEADSAGSQLSADGCADARAGAAGGAGGRGAGAGGRVGWLRSDFTPRAGRVVGLNGLRFVFLLLVLVLKLMLMLLVTGSVQDGEERRS